MIWLNQFMLYSYVNVYDKWHIGETYFFMGKKIYCQSNEASFHIYRSRPAIGISTYITDTDNSRAIMCHVSEKQVLMLRMCNKASLDIYGRELGRTVKLSKIS